MGENVQCPVCTLFLHAGMNLSDHLETHPKEQVIKALVQMTISGSGGTIAGTALAASLSGGGESKADPDEKPKTETIVADANATSNATPSKLSPFISAGPTQNNSLNFTAAFSAISAITKPSTSSAAASTATATVGPPVDTAAITKGTGVKDIVDDKTECVNNGKEKVKVSPTTVAPLSAVGQILPGNFEEFSANRYGKTQQKQISPSQLEQQQQKRQQNENQHDIDSVSASRANAPQRTALAPPPPTVVPLPLVVGQIPNKLLHPSHSATLFASNVTTHRQVQMHPIQQSHPHVQNQFQQQQQSHNLQQQNLKLYYSTALPTPPPTLQLFPFHATTQIQHQKPPPAYGTAISQIRSQHNQNKNKHPTGDKNQVHHHHQQQPQPQQLHQQLQQLPQQIQQPTMHPAPLQARALTTLQLHHRNQQQTLANIPTLNIKPSILPKPTELLPPPPPPTRTSNNLQQLHQHLPHSMSTFVHSMKASPAVHQRGATAGSEHSAMASVTTLTQAHSSNTVSHATAGPAIIAIASAGGIRQVSSPYNSLMTAAQSPSSSVLRYAESPVAHYLERDNGDFIVQETPKHIVECVEKDNGEFSVIERIYQSPLSVLHIHEDNEKDDEGGDNDESDIKDNDKKKVQTIPEQTEGSEVETMDIECPGSPTETIKSGEEDKCEQSASDRSPQVNNAETSVDNSTAEGNVETKGYTSERSSASPSNGSNSNANSDAGTPLHSASVDSLNTEIINDPIAVSSSSSNINTESNVVPISSSSSNQSSNSAGTSRKRSSKNTITVLSDVQLNLDEYLDLVGNIIASSKITAKSSALSGAMPIPLLKVEKEEPIDDDYEINNQPPDQHKFEELKDGYFNEENQINEFPESTVIEPPTTANKNETEKIVENNSSSNKVRINDSDNDTKAASSTMPQMQSANTSALTSTSATGPSTATCSSHVTSVIRMATTSQQQQPQKEVPQSAVDFSAVIEKKSQKLYAELATSSNKTQVTSIIIQDLSRQHFIQLQEEQQAHKDEHQQQQQLVNVQPESDSQAELDTQAPLLSSLPVQKRGPKKLVIKPKVTKTDANANLNQNNKSNISQTQNINSDFKEVKLQVLTEEALCEQPTTSSKARMELEEKTLQQHKEHQMTHTIAHKLIKSEPNTSVYEANINRVCIKGNTLGHSILENHLNSSSNNCETIIQCKTEQEPQASSLQLLKEETKEITNSNDNDDARVLLDFANSKKREPTHTSVANFLSATSIFSNTSNTMNEKKPTTGLTITNTNSTESHAALRCEDEFIAHDDVQEIVVSSSYSQSQSASDVPTTATNSTTTSNAKDLITVQQQQQQQQQQHQHQQQQHQLNHNFTDYPFSFLYGNGGGVAAGVQQTDAKGGNFSAIYQQATQDATTAATLASGSNTVHTDESTSSTHQQQAHTNRFGSVRGGSGDIGNNASHWYHHAMATANADFETALGVDCNAAVDGGDVGKYLDLDTCKREIVVGMPGAPSSTSSSFAAATESSLAGGCTTDALNIRTDEKMPAKGEISGQESNCDIENSWSQPMYGELSARFFKTTFPGIFQHENGWNHDEYFTVQDLSASAAATGNATSSNRSGKSFDFRLPLEASTSAAANGNNNFQLFARHADALPSTSSTNKKKRKRDSNARADKTGLSRMQPTATITSQQLLLHQQQQQQQQLQAHDQLQHLQHSDNIATSTALMMGGTTASDGTAAANATTSLSADQRRQRKKVYQCTHCTAEFPKLKDRNSHMITQHNYVRQNRRLICVQRPATIAPTGAAVPSSSDTIAGGVDNVVVVNMADGYNSTVVRSDSMEFLEDSKQDIVKIEVDNVYQPLTSANAPVVTAASTSGSGEGIDSKPELLDKKPSLALLPASSSNANDEGDGVGDAVDTKPALQPLAMTTPAAKLAALYRMLVSYNISTLKDSHNLSELEQKVIEQSIFFCYVCRRNFTSVKLYDAHLSEHPAECFTCGKTFQRWKNFSLHLKRHLGWKEFGCNVCDKKFVVRSALVEHMRMHTGHTPLKCKVCGKYFKRYSNLTQHRKRHGKQIIRKKEYVCHCGEVLPSKARFLWHKETHDAKPKCCPYCCDRFVHANSLRRHIRLAHSDKFDYTEPMECPLCKQTFAKSSIKAHMATHSMDTQHDCPICSKSFSTKWNLKIHSWVHANRTAKPFKCEHCPKAFVREVDFKNHMNAHKQIKPYTCEYCGCKFIRKYNYMRHRREHHGNKKFTCDLCKKSFHRHYYLIEHRRIHTGERPFQCTICGKSSTTKTNHNKHLKIHHSRDPFTVEA
ncbi:PREDICTED: uncharacterized protein LOC108372510 [Rhagoletis zephyria]|uniref:uncharacterized protein LOC108372510 n=1 Tax=Rhagoletis zephyria TaxID=28612 RepID=UPI00081169CA|nr:PREDICTED: uncharacterized protein LOC108372510 [Rhagoletis zephyria]